MSHYELKMINKLIIGTANFGLRYGIANDKKLSREESFAILDHARTQGIQWLDTARAYGDAESVIGAYFEKYGKVFKVIGKLPAKEYPDAQAVQNEVYGSLKNMNIASFDAFLVHSFKTYDLYGNKIVPVLQSLCKEGIIENYGVSVYHPEQVAVIAERTKDRLAVEFPLNLFDQRFLRDGLMQGLRSRGSLLFARSVFLQGLFFLKGHALNGRFEQAKEKIGRISDMSSARKMRPECLALLFAAQKPWVDGVVIGVDSSDQLRSNIECMGSADLDKYALLEHMLPQLAIDDEDVILPYRWKV